MKASEWFKKAHEAVDNPDVGKEAELLEIALSLNSKIEDESHVAGQQAKSQLENGKFGNSRKDWTVLQEEKEEKDIERTELLRDH